MKFGLIVGHSPMNPGARAYNKVREYEFNKAVCGFMGMDFYSRPDGHKYPVNVTLLTRKMQEDGITHSLELHFNAITGSQVVRGSTTLCFDKPWSNKISSIYQQELETRMNITKRPIKYLEHNERGYSNIKILERYGIENVIVEPTFCHVEHFEAKNIMENPQGYASCINHALHLAGVKL